MKFVDRPVTVYAGWGTAGVALGVLASQFTEWNRIRLVAVAQSFTPVLALSGIPVAIVGARRRSPSMTAAGLTASVGLASVVLPALRGRQTLSLGAPGKSQLTIAHANLLYLNVDRAAQAAAALLATGADVLAMSELTVHHYRALVALGAEDQYPYRVGRAAKRSEGIALWSRIPLVDVRTRQMDNRPGIVATAASETGQVRIVLAHPDPPTSRRGLRRWASSLELIGSIAGAPGPPTVIVADLNAARWHPVLRRLLRRGWCDAHEMVGRGFSVSWPTGSRFVPPFVRLDHALIGQGVGLVGVRDFDVPGSDHRGFLLTVSVAIGGTAESMSSRVAVTRADSRSAR